MWKDIEGYEGYYQVSDSGEIKSLERWIERKDGKANHILEKIVKTSIINTGYEKVMLHKDGKVKNFLLQHIVAKAFPEICGEWFDGCEIDHINGIRTDNRAVNLKTVTHSDNMSNQITKERMTSHKNNPKKSKVVEQYTKDGHFIKTYPSTVEAYRQTGIAYQSIQAVCKGRKNGFPGGYLWKYA